MNVGLVLGAGGVAGHAFHAGVLRALHETTGWDPRTAELIVGTSAGSVVGLGLRAGLSAPDMYARTVGETISPEGEALLAPLPPPAQPEDGGPWWTAAPSALSRLPLPSSPGMAVRLALRPWQARPGVVLAGVVPEGRIDVSPIAADADRLVGSLGHEITGLWVVAVRLSDGRRIVFGRERRDGWTWGQAVASSCAIPGFFTPVVIGDDRFVDGGAHSPTNADLVRRRPLDLVIVSSPMSSVRTARHPSIDAPFRAAYRLRLGAEVARLRRHGVQVVTFQPTRSVLRAGGLNAMNPEMRIPVARAAYEAALQRCERDDFHLAASLAG